MEKEGDDSSSDDFEGLPELPQLQPQLSRVHSSLQSQIMLPENIVYCRHCKFKFNIIQEKNKIVEVSPCKHIICKKCLITQVKIRYLNKGGQLKCLASGCESKLTGNELKQVLSKYKLAKYRWQLLKDKFKNIKACIENPVECIKCKLVVDFENGRIGDLVGIKDDNGHRLTIWAKDDYAKNRFKCPGCRLEQCRECGKTPYHRGLTCEQVKKHEVSTNCRYCDAEIHPKNRAFDDICKDDECVDKMKNACNKKLDCGHPCGLKGEKSCLPCLFPECEEKTKKILKCSGDDYCVICYCEKLINAPCVRQKCGHVFHVHCLMTKFKKRWHTPRIFFSFAQCASCNAWPEFHEDNIMSQECKEIVGIQDIVYEKSLQRLKHEKVPEDVKRLQDPKDPYYKKEQELAFATYAYYLCFECKKPYFGGRVDCLLLLQQANNNKFFKPEELHGPCCVRVGLGDKDCDEHGTDFIDYKCRYCCSVALWFCFGTTHFCDACHNNWQALEKKNPAELPGCGGKDSCPLGVDHPPNGQEFSLGCGLCREKKLKHEDF